MIYLKTSNPIAKESKDRIVPGGSMMDSTSNPEFAVLARKLFVDKRPFSLLDLGCSDGSAVFDILQLKNCQEYKYHNIFAVGLEGSDYPLIRRRGYWQEQYVGKNLFLCDISEKFDLYSSNVYEHCYEEVNWKFDVVTCWEVMEHIPEKQLPVLCDNVRRHLMADGIWIMSVSNQQGYHHETIRPRDWWIKMFESEGFVHSEKIFNHFNGNFLRGPEEPSSFNLCLRTKEMESGIYFK